MTAPVTACEAAIRHLGSAYMQHVLPKAWVGAEWWIQVLLPNPMRAVFPSRKHSPSHSSVCAHTCLQVASNSYEVAKCHLIDEPDQHTHAS